jgi:hypothetical protein
MNVATDIIRLSGAASLVPGLSVAFKLAIMIIQTVQVCRLDTYVSHLVAESSYQHRKKYGREMG